MNTTLRRVTDTAPSFCDASCHGLQVAVSGLCDAVYLKGSLTEEERADVLTTIERERARLVKLETFCQMYRDQK